MESQSKLLQRVAIDTRTNADEILEESFTDRVGPLVDSGFRLACALLHDTQAAEDAVQEASIIAWRKFRKLDDLSRIRPWFFTIVANECRNARRRGWRSRVQLGLPPGLAVGPADEGSVSRADLRNALLKLPHQDRLVVVLFYFLDLPQAEIAAISGLSAAGVRNRLYRTVRRLRPNLALQEALQ